VPVAFAFSVGGPPPGGTADAGSDGAPPSAEYTRLFVLGGEAHLETQATPPSGADLGELILPGTGEREAVTAAPAALAAAPRPAVGRGATPARSHVAAPAPRRALPLVIAALLLLVAVAAAVFLLARSRSVPSPAATPTRPRRTACPRRARRRAASPAAERPRGRGAAAPLLDGRRPRPARWPASAAARIVRRRARSSIRSLMAVRTPCPRCGTVTGPDARFCPSCGSAIAAPDGGPGSPRHPSRRGTWPRPRWSPAP
jgi:hypothetical protein